KRVTKLEKGIGSWQISGRFKFDAKFTNGDQDADSQFLNQKENHTTKNEFAKEYARLYFRRQITEDTYFDSEFRVGAWAASGTQRGQGDTKQMSWNKFYIGTKLPFWGLNARIGRFSWDWESEYGLVNAFDSLFGDYRGDAFEFKKKWDKVSLTGIIYRNYNNEGEQALYVGGQSSQSMNYALKLDYVADKWFLAGFGNWMQFDGGKETSKEVVANASGHVHTYGIYAGYKFTQDIALKGAYYWQKLSSDLTGKLFGEDSSSENAWKVVLDIKQPALKFTSLWVEYAQMTGCFLGNNAMGGVTAYSFGFKADSDKGLFWGATPEKDGKFKVWNIRAAQKWTKKFSTELIFMQLDNGLDGADKTKAFGINASYKLNPAVTCTLGYDWYDYGGDKDAKTGGNQWGHYGKDGVLFFRTDVKF
ncbi:MAG: hypothetical protein Q4E34_06505, partial [Synergistaceae bacterium]|nr:hypothetical protein [Synergistaceae bacterium]